MIKVLTKKPALTESHVLPATSSSGPTVRLTVGFTDALTMPEKDQRDLIGRAVANLNLGRFTRSNRHLIVAALMSAGYSDLAVDFVRELGQSMESLHREFSEACGILDDGKVKP